VVGVIHGALATRTRRGRQDEGVLDVVTLTVTFCAAPEILGEGEIENVVPPLHDA
jgi:hypothetical protein